MFEKITSIIVAVSETIYHPARADWKSGYAQDMEQRTAKLAKHV